MESKKPHRNNHLLKMLSKLTQQESSFIPFKDIVKSFPEMGRKYDMGNAKWIRPLRIFNDNGFVHFVAEGFMPKGRKYTKNHHDCKEILTVLSGRLRDTVFKITKTDGGQYSWESDTTHALLAIEDTKFHFVLKIEEHEAIT